MKIQRLLLLLTLVTHSLMLRAQDKKINTVSFVTKIDIQEATKDGIYLNGYVVNIPYEKLVKLNGKKVRISGKVTIVKGIKQYDDIKIRQGREKETKHILKPKIILLPNNFSTISLYVGRDVAVYK